MDCSIKQIPFNIGNFKPTGLPVIKKPPGKAVLRGKMKMLLCMLKPLLRYKVVEHEGMLNIILKGCCLNML